MAADRRRMQPRSPRPPRGYLSCDAASNQCDPDRRQGEVEVAQQAAARAPADHSRAIPDRYLCRSAMCPPLREPRIRR